MGDRIGRFQFVLGRELGATFYGYGFENTTVVPAPTPAASRASSTSSRSASTCRSSNTAPTAHSTPSRARPVLFQLLCRRRRPETHRRDLAAGSTAGEAREIYSIGIRVIFDWRRYFWIVRLESRREALHSRPCRNTMYERGLLP